MAFQSVAGEGWAAVRKEACSFGYDWAPKVTTQGIWRAAYAVGLNRFSVSSIAASVLSEPSDPPAPLTDDDNKFSVTVRMQLYSPVAETLQVRITGNWSGGMPVWSGQAAAGPTSPVFVATLTAANVQLWWPNGYGAQPLYSIQIHAATSDGKAEVDAAPVSMGFRSVNIIARPPSTPGPKQFYKINGVPIFVKGANWVVCFLSLLLALSSPSSLSLLSLLSLPSLWT